MSSFLSVVDFKTKLNEEEFTNSLNILNHWSADRTNTIVEENSAFGHLMLHTTKESLTEHLPFHDKASSLIINCDARIDNREELSEILGESVIGCSDSTYILEAYKRWGNDCVAHLLGDFAFTIWNANKQELFCARDHIGIAPFYYYFKDSKFICSTEVKGIASAFKINKTLDEVKLYTALIGRLDNISRTAYQHIKVLPPSHSMVVNSHSVSLKRYWNPEKTDVLKSKKNEEVYIREFLKLLTTSVECRLRSVKNIGSELSGGLDSAGIAGIAQMLLREKQSSLFTFSHVAPVNSTNLKDERNQIAQIVDHLNLNQSVFLNGKHSMNDIFKTVIDIYDQPHNSTFAMYCDELFEAANLKEVNVLFSGLGGDQCVSSQVSGFKEILIKNHEWKWLWKELKAAKTPTLKLVTILLIEKLVGTLTQRAAKRKKIRNPTNLERFLNTSFVNSIDFSILDVAQHNNGTPNEITFASINESYLTQHTAEAKMMGHHYKLEYRYPLLDVRLLEYYLKMPLGLKLKNGIPRYAYRKAIEDLLPTEIVWRADKTIPSIPTAKQRAEQFREELIDRLRKLPSNSIAHNYFNVKQLIQEGSSVKQYRRFVFQMMFNAIILNKMGAK